MIAIPLNPRIDPIDRSNSPAIISSATATARMPERRRTVEDRGRHGPADEVVLVGDDGEEDPHDDRADQCADLRAG
jgi:hypothetical protein